MKSIISNPVRTALIALSVIALAAAAVLFVAQSANAWTGSGGDGTGTCSSCGGSSSGGSSGGGGSYTPPPAPAPTCKLIASPATIESGGNVTLTWSTKNADTVTLSGFGDVPKNNHSRIDRNVTQDKTYTLTVKGNGKTVTCKDTVKVKPQSAPECTIALSKYTIDYKGSVTVTWTSKNADTVTLNGSSVSKNGSKTFTNLTADKTFTIKSKSGGKEVTCVKTVEVTDEQSHTDAPECDLWLSDYDIDKGDNVTVSWDTTNADVVKLNGSTVNKNSSKVFYDLNNDKTFTLEVWNKDDEKVTCSKTVEVGSSHNNLSCDLFVSEDSIRSGEGVKLTWESDNADYGYINNSIGRVDDYGSKNIYPRSTTTYKATFYGDNDEEVRCSVTVYVDNYPTYIPQTPYVTLSSVPYTGLDMSPEMAALYWAFVAVWCLVAAYLIAVKKAHYAIARSLKGFLFGAEASALVATSAGSHAAAHNTHADAHAHNAHTHGDETDEFILSQIHRK